MERYGANMTRWDKVKNWFDYHKWLVVIAVVVAVALIPVVKNLLGIGVVYPDYQLAIVTTRGVSDRAAEELQTGMEALGEDLNGDGQVVVSVVQYRTVTGDAETAYYMNYASSITLHADIERKDSHFFLVEDPEQFQINYQLLADAAGQMPEDTDFSIGGRVYALRMPLSEESAQEIDGLAFGQRGYYEEGKVKHLDAYRRFFAELSGEVLQ